MTSDDDDNYNNKNNINNNNYNNYSNTRVQGLRQKKIYTNADGPDDNDQQFDRYGPRDVRDSVSDRVVCPHVVVVVVGFCGAKGRRLPGDKGVVVVVVNGSGDVR